MLAFPCSGVHAGFRALRPQGSVINVRATPCLDCGSLGGGSSQTLMRNRSGNIWQTLPGDLGRLFLGEGQLFLFSERSAFVTRPRGRSVLLQC